MARRGIVPHHLARTGVVDRPRPPEFVPPGRHSSITGAYVPLSRSSEEGRLPQQVRANAQSSARRAKVSMPVLSIQSTEDGDA